MEVKAMNTKGEETTSTINPLKVETRDSALDIIHRVFPLKTKELTDILKSDPIYKFESHHTELAEWPVSESEKEDEDSKAKKRKLNEYNSSNMNIKDLKFPLHGTNNKISPRVKSEVGEMINYLNIVRLWIQVF